MSSLKQNRTPRYKFNPFVVDMIVPLKKQQVRISPLGQDKNVLINQETGEISGTHTITYKRVDADEFVKLFTKNIALTFDLGPAGIKAFNVLAWIMQKTINKDEVDLDSLMLADFVAATPRELSYATFMRGLSELEKAQIIAKTMRQGRYFINPNFLFNGNRLAFTQIIERVNSNNKIEDDPQELPLGFPE